MLYWLWLSAAGLDKIFLFLCKENTVLYYYYYYYYKQIQIEK